MRITLLLLIAALGLVLWRLRGVRSSAVSSPPVLTHAQALARGLKTISFVHFNDFHAHYNPHDYGGTVLSPLSLIRGYFDEVKAENPNTIFCSAGDDMEKGSLAELVSKGETTIEIYKHLGLDLRALGNHDFAYSLDSVRRFAETPGTVVLCANEGIAKDYHQFEVEGVRIGVFALVSLPWDERNDPYDGPYYNEITHSSDYVGIVNRMVREHRDEVDLLFMLNHVGLKADERLADSVPGIDFIIGGHSHDVLHAPKMSANGTVIVQAGSYGVYVGRLDINVDPKSRRMAGYRYALKVVDPSDMRPNLGLESKIREISE